MNSITTIIPTPRPVKRVALIVFAAVIYSLNLNSFVRTAGLFPGGFSGITLLVQRLSEKFLGLEIPYTPLYLALNAAPVYISFRFIGKKFTLYSLLMIFLSSVLTDLVPRITGFTFTHDRLLCAVFGGIVNGFAVSCCLRADATSGGTDFIAIYFSEKKGADMWNRILMMNVCVLAVAGVLFGWESALYSIIFQFTSTQVLNMLYRRYQKVTMLIITERPDDLYDAVRSLTNHDATKFEGTGCYSRAGKTLLYTVVSADECGALTQEIRQRDPKAFVNILQSKGILGRFFVRMKE